MTAQPPLNLVAETGVVPVGPAAVLVEDEAGGRVYVHGNLVHVWDSGEDGIRRLAAVQLIHTKAAKVGDVAFGFGVQQPTLWRWRTQLADAGVAGLVSDKRGPKGPSRVTPQVEQELRDRRDRGQTLQTIATALGISVSTVGRIAAQSEPSPRGGHPGQGRATRPDHGTKAREGGPHEAKPEEVEEDGEGEASVVPVLPAPVDRGGQRALARTGRLSHVPPVFAPAGRVPLAGLFLGLTALEATGLLTCAGEVFGALPNGFYGLETTLLEAVFRTLAGEPRAEGATRVDPVALGRVLGMDRAPEVKTIRRKLTYLAGTGKSADLLQAMAAAKLTANDAEDVAAVLYVDGHVRAYYGDRKIAKQHSTRLKFPAPATVETWVSDSRGDPILVVMTPPGASLASELRRLLPTLREAIGDQRRVLVGFDRGGWSPALFAHMHARGFDVLTWRKGRIPDLNEDQFTVVEHADPDTGRCRTWEAADTLVDLPLNSNLGNTGSGGSGGPEVFSMRQISARVTAPGGGVRQIHLLTTRTDLGAGEVLHTMGSRWRQENHFRYARMHFDLDAHDGHTATEDDPERLVPNPAKKSAYAHVHAAKAQLDRARAQFDADLLDTHPQHSGQEVLLTNAEHNLMIAPLLAAEEDYEHTKKVHKDLPARVPLGELAPGQQVLDIETKLLNHAIRIAAFNTVTALVRDLRIHTTYARANDEAHAFIRQVLTQPGDIRPDPETGTLTIRLDALPTRRATAAAAQLCAHLSAAQTTYPGTNLTLRYEIKPPETLHK